MGKLRIPALLAHKQWTIAKIFQVILLLDVLNGVLVTRGVFPWSYGVNNEIDRLVFCGAGRGGANADFVLGAASGAHLHRLSAGEPAGVKAAHEAGARRRGATTVLVGEASPAYQNHMGESLPALGAHG